MERLVVRNESSIVDYVSRRTIDVVISTTASIRKNSYDSCC